MSDRIEKLLIDGKKVNVTFYKIISQEQISEFIRDVERHYTALENKSDIFTQQLVHALLLIKHFTDYEIKMNTAKDVLAEGQKFTNDGLLETFARFFDIRIINRVNRELVNYFMIHHDEYPSYLNVPSKEQVEFEKQFVKEYLDENNEFDDSDDDEDDKDDFDEEEIFKAKIKSSYKQPLKRVEVKEKNMKKTKEPSTDQLLDEYNDNITFFNIFGNKKYQKRADHIMKVLKGEEKYVKYIVRS